MHTVELYAKVRRFVVVDPYSQREAGRHFGISRDMVAKMAAHAQPPGYRRSAPVPRPKLEPSEADKKRHQKQQHTAKRIFERLRDEHRYTGKYTVVKHAVREQTLRHQEMFVPLVHPPGHAQVDFDEAVVVVGWVEQKGHLLAMDLQRSDAPFVMIFPKETTEAFCQGHVEAFTRFGVVPQSHPPTAQLKL